MYIYLIYNLFSFFLFSFSLPLLFILTYVYVYVFIYIYKLYCKYSNEYILKTRRLGSHFSKVLTNFLFSNQRSKISYHFFLLKNPYPTRQEFSIELYIEVSVIRLCVCIYVCVCACVLHAYKTKALYLLYVGICDSSWEFSHNK